MSFELRIKKTKNKTWIVHEILRAILQKQFYVL